MKQADVDDHMRISENFQSHLRTEADREMVEGDEVGAGLLLVLARRVQVSTNDWRRSIQIDRDAAAAPAAVVELKARHRHDFLASITKGDNPPVCACGAKKNPNGRPRGQQVVVPAVKGPVFP